MWCVVEGATFKGFETRGTSVIAAQQAHRFFFAFVERPHAHNHADVVVVGRHGSRGCGLKGAGGGEIERGRVWVRIAARGGVLNVIGGGGKELGLRRR